jgi:hypothetical protein
VSNRTLEDVEMLSEEVAGGGCVAYVESQIDRLLSDAAPQVMLEACGATESKLGKRNQKPARQEARLTVESYCRDHRAKTRQSDGRREAHRNVLEMR